MMELKKIGINEIQFLADYFLKNRNNIEKIIDDFGEISDNNNHGTIFLNPKNSIFKVFWVRQSKNTIESIGFGGPALGLNLKDLYFHYNKFKETFNRYDNEYVYVFSSPTDDSYAINITSPDKIIEGENIIKNIDINGIVIMLS